MLEMNMYANAMHEMTWYEMHEKRKQHTETRTRTRENKYNLMPKRQEWSTNWESYIRGVTTLHHYERISSRDLGQKERRVLRTEVILAFPGSFTVGMV